MLHEGGEGDAARDGGPVTRVVDEVDRPGLGHEVDGGNEHDQERRAEDLDRVQAERFHDAHDLLRSNSENFDQDSGHHRNQQEGQDVVYEVLVAQFYVLELHGRGEVRQDLRHF